MSSAPGVTHPVMAAKAAIHAFLEAKESGRFFAKKLRKKLSKPSHEMFQRSPASGQKFFAELFFKKATAFWCSWKGVDGRFRGHDGVGDAGAFLRE